MLIVAERPITRSGEACDEAFLVDALTKDWTVCGRFPAVI